MTSQPTGLLPGVYILKNVATGTVLDLWYGNAGEHIPITAYALHGGDNQKWYLERSGTSSNMTLRNLKSSTYLSFKRFQPGASISGSATPQQWSVSGGAEGYVLEPTDHCGYVLDLTASNPASETPVILYPNLATDNQKWHFIPSSGNLFSLGASIQAPSQAILPPGPNRVDPQESLGQIVAGSSQPTVSKYMFKWSWQDPRSDISIEIGFSINSNIPVPSFKSAGAPAIKSLQVKYDRSRGKPYGFCSFDGAIGDKKIYIEIPDWLIEIRGAIEGGPNVGHSFTGEGSWLSS